jgi:hypothetical protein
MRATEEEKVQPQTKWGDGLATDKELGNSPRRSEGKRATDKTEKNLPQMNT